MEQKKLQMVERILRQSNCYKGKKDSNQNSRFDFKVDKGSGDVVVFNAEKGNNLFLWCDEISGLAHGMGLSFFVTFDYYDLKKVIMRIY